MGLAGSVGLGAATPRARAVCGHRAACFYADSRTHSSEQPGGAGAALVGTAKARAVNELAQGRSHSRSVASSAGAPIQAFGVCPRPSLLTLPLVQWLRLFPEAAGPRGFGG